MTVCLAALCFYLLCDVEVARVNAVCEQILCAAALAGAKHTVVGLEQLPAGRGGGTRSNEQWFYAGVWNYR